ncbi:MAG: primosome assembly protein PriA, partial [Nitriliruptorales bacterium]
MTGSAGAIARVVVEVAPDHLDRPFDYRIPPDLPVRPGCRVEVVFSGRRVRGLVTDVAATTDVAESRLRDVRRLLGEHVWVTEEELDVLRWAATRYAGPLAAVVRHALPSRVVDVERRASEEGWYPGGERPADPQQPPVDTSAWAAYGDDGPELLDLAARGGTPRFWRPLPGEDLPARTVELAGATLAGGRDVLLVVPEPVSRVADAVVGAFK